MGKTMIRTVALASVLASAIAGVSDSQAQTYRDDTTVAPATPVTDVGPGTATDSIDSPDDLADDEHDATDDDAVDTLSGTATGDAIHDRRRSNDALTDQAMMSSAPMQFELFDRRWCVGDGASADCDVKVVAPGLDAFTLFGETWCLNEAPGRSCDVRVGGDDDLSG